jgi:hypothetical protein
MVKVRPITKMVLLTAMTAGVSLFLLDDAKGQGNGAQNSDSGVYGGAYYPEGDYGHTYFPRWTVQYGPSTNYYSWGGSHYRPLQPGDWGCGPYGPRHNLNASQRSPSGMTWW